MEAKNSKLQFVLSQIKERDSKIESQAENIKQLMKALEMQGFKYSQLHKKYKYGTMLLKILLTISIIENIITFIHLR